MSRTLHGQKGPGYDYWKRRLHFSASWGFGKMVKILTSRVHRRIARRQIDAGDFDGVEVTNKRHRGMTPT